MASDATEARDRDSISLVSHLDTEPPALIWNVDAERGAFGFNHGWKRLSGLGEEDLSADGWLAFVHPDDQVMFPFLRDPVVAHAPQSLEIRIRDAMGRYRWFLVNCDAANPAAPRSVVALSIDARKSAELEAADVRAMLDNAPTMMWRTTATGEMDYANERYLRAWGQTSDQIKGWGWKDSVHPDDRQGIVDYWDSHRHTDGDGTYEFRAGTPETGYRWYLSVCSARCDDEGNVHQWYGATFDIEDRKQADARLRRSEAFLRQGQMISMTGTVALNRLTGEHYWSEEAYRILGLDQSVTPGFEAVLPHVHADDLAQVLAAIERIKNGESDVDFEYRVIRPDGRIKHVRALVNPGHADDDGVNVSGVVMDITAAKLAEEEMHRAQADLLRVTRIATMAELTASIAHEINQPISGVLTNSEACLRWIDRPEPNLEEAREALERTVIGARRVSEVVRQLRAIFARKHPEPTQFKLGDLVGNTLPLLRSHMNQYRASIMVDLADDEPRVLADQIQIQQVIINLVMNGLQAPREAGAERRIIVRTVREADQVGLSVTDNGRGIEEDHLPKIFEPFFTTKSEGMGMGLSICRSVVELHGGSIFARGNDEGGATVGFIFPIDC